MKQQSRQPKENRLMRKKGPQTTAPENRGQKTACQMRWRTQTLTYPFSLPPAGVHIESVNSHGQTPLFCASFGGDNEVVALLLRLGANPNRRCGSKGATPVHGAAYRGSRRVLRLLVEAGGDLTFRDYENQTPRWVWVLIRWWDEGWCACVRERWANGLIYS